MESEQETTIACLHRLKNHQGRANVQHRQQQHWFMWAPLVVSFSMKPSELHLWWGNWADSLRDGTGRRQFVLPRGTRKIVPDLLSAANMPTQKALWQCQLEIKCEAWLVKASVSEKMVRGIPLSLRNFCRAVCWRSAAHSRTRDGSARQTHLG